MPARVYVTGISGSKVLQTSLSEMVFDVKSKLCLSFINSSEFVDLSKKPSYAVKSFHEKFSLKIRRIQ